MSRTVSGCFVSEADRVESYIVQAIAAKCARPGVLLVQTRLHLDWLQLAIDIQVSDSLEEPDLFALEAELFGILRAHFEDTAVAYSWSVEISREAPCAAASRVRQSARSV